MEGGGRNDGGRRALLAAILVLASPLAAQQPALIPMPASVAFADSGFTLPDTVSIAVVPATPRMHEIAAVLASALAEHGIATRFLDGPFVGDGILLRIGSPAVDDESYELVSTSHGVLVEGRAEAGVLWGVQTLRQLLEPTATGWQVHGAGIADAPKFAWRGSMLDVGRHLFPVEYILRHLDWMSRYKLNVFHWHLTEDQGWRLAIDAYPRLTSVAAWRRDPAALTDPDSVVSPTGQLPPEGGVAAEGGRYGGFYTKDDVRRVVERARQLGITVVPEIEMPGHSRAALAAYPDLGCSNDTLPVPATWGVFTDVLCPGKESTFAFLEAVLTEVLELFPSPYIHVGGDEVPKQSWAACPPCQAIIRREKLGDEHGLQRWMIARIGRWLRERGRTLIGWDEILEGGLPEGATVQAWRGESKINEAISAGADVIASPSEWTYLNGSAGSLPLDRVAMFAPASHAATGAGRLLGIEAPLWTEHVTSPANAELMWWPRLLAISEVGWHGPADTAEFRGRAELVAAQMRSEGVAVGPEDRALVSLRFRYDSATGSVRIANDDEVTGLRVTLESSGQEARVVHDGDRLPGAGTWQLSARWNGELVGEARTIIAVDHLAVGQPIHLATPTDSRYPGTGAQTLVDGVRGTDFHDGFWNGWQGPDLDATIDLGSAQPVHSVALSLLEEVNSWILYPVAVAVYYSQDGSTWQLAERRELDQTVTAGAASRKLVSFDLPTGTTARYLRVVADGGRTLPAWHLGAGGAAWIFADEVEVR